MTGSPKVSSPKKTIERAKAVATMTPNATNSVTGACEPAHEATDRSVAVEDAMTGNSTGGSRRLSRALACTVIIAGLASSQAAAQLPLACRADYAYTCYEDQAVRDIIETGSYLVTPLTTILDTDEPTWSPDGSRIAVVNRGTTVGPNTTWSCIRTTVGNGDLYVISPFGGGVRLTNLGGTADPAWSPDGGQIAFALSTSTSSQIDVINPDGSSLRRVTSTAVLQAGHPT